MLLMGTVLSNVVPIVRKMVLVMMMAACNRDQALHHQEESQTLLHEETLELAESHLHPEPTENLFYIQEN